MPAPYMRIVGFSGGADSQAVTLWARQRFGPANVLLLNSNAGGNEHPITEQFIRDYSERVHPVIVIPALMKDLGDVGTRAGQTKDRRKEFAPDDLLTFDLLAYIKGRFPSAKAQFCTEYLKLAPQKRWMQEHATGILAGGFERYIGVRADESHRRSKLEETEWDTYFDCQLNRPLLTWSKAQVFSFIRANGEEVNPLYKMGFKRVGCAPCINCTKEEVRLWAARFPEAIDKVRAWEEQTGRTFFAPCVPGKALNHIDEVVRWSRTEWGGKQFMLPLLEADAASGTCVSKYGLCE
jgi:3'-phosphoadenosine 5'-phosphosulfate sulfotransferase (PAPS reductase)/FAD synthetase